MSEQPRGEPHRQARPHYRGDGGRRPRQADALRRQIRRQSRDRTAQRLPPRADKRRRARGDRRRAQQRGRRDRAKTAAEQLAKRILASSRAALVACGRHATARRTAAHTDVA
eukprot:5680317-Pleurochrysis_carterae.AAC.7